MMGSIKFAAFLAALTFAAGCDSVESQLEPCTETAALTSDNALSMNALSMNALSMNALSMNALSMNGLLESDVLDTEEGRTLVKYIVHCALPDDVTLSNSEDGRCDGDEPGTYTFTGGLGLAPDWLDGAIDTAASQRVSACLLSHVNYFGASVSISVRHPQLVTPDDEIDRFPTYEGAFFGQLFSEDPQMFVCTGKAGPTFDVEYPNHDTSQGDRLLRRCTDKKASSTMCDFTYVGTCKSSCRTIDKDGLVADCHGGPGKSGELYPEAITTWLLDADDEQSIWPTAYPLYYGP